MMEMDYLLDIVRREAQHAIGARQWKGQLVSTSYDPKKHAIKGILVPSEVETGWIPISVQHAGDGFGILSGPNVGSADKLDGDVFDVEFENGDPNTPIAKHKHFSAADNPPVVQAGETLIKHQTGGSSLFKTDGSIITTHKDGGKSMFDKDGHHTLDTKGKKVMITTSGGKVELDSGGADVHLKSGSGKLKIDGMVAING